MPDTPRVVVIRRYFDPFEARLSITALHAAAIPAVLRNEHHVSAFPGEAIALGGIEVVVPAALAQEAEEILSRSSRAVRTEPDRPDTDTSHGIAPASPDSHALCPRCGSADVPLHARFHRLATALAVAGFPVLSALKRRRCRLCGCIFPVHGRA